MRSPAVLLPLVLLVAPAPAQRPAPPQQQAPAGLPAARGPLEGLWLTTTIEVEEALVPIEERKVYVAFTEQHYIATGQGGVIMGNYRVHSGKTPNAVDVTYTAGPDTGKTGRLIFELKGDTLRVCGPLDADGPRPARFPDNAPGPGVFVATHKKVTVRPGE